VTGTRRDPHLGVYAAALVDGALDHDTRDRALAHLVECEICRCEVETQRRVKHRLAELSGPPCPKALEVRLITLTATSTVDGFGVDGFGVDDLAVDGVSCGGQAMPTAADTGHAVGRRAFAAAVDSRSRPLAGAHGSSPTRPNTPSRAARAGRAGGAGRSGMPARPSSPGRPTRRGGTGTGDVRPGSRSFVRRRARRIASTVGGVAAFAACLLAVAAAGSVEQTSAPVTPAVENYTVVHQRSADRVVGTDPVVGLVEVSTTSGRPSSGPTIRR
jgi:hypothetical protein